VKQRGFSLLEMLVILAVLGILLGIAIFAGRDIIRKQNELQSVNQIRQLLWQAGTTVNARGTSGKLSRTGNVLKVLDVNSGKTLVEATLDSKVVSNLPIGDSLVFLSSGRIESATLDSLPDPLTVTAAGKTFKLTVSVIGEIKAEVMP
jgi:prepilin-type N-terminal cleavage/methylation domain-containing protein